MSISGCSTESTPPSGTPSSGSLSVEEAKGFKDFPVYWLGETFQDLPLERISRYVWSDPVGDQARGGLDTSQDFVGLNYGKCTIPAGQDEGGCPVPLYVRITPYCKVPPDLIADRVRNGDFFEFRGAKGLWILGESQLVLWTGEVNVSISSPMGKDVVESAAEQLVSLNGTKTRSAADDLPPDAAPTCPPKHPLILD
jgi:hypothetical protein